MAFEKNIWVMGVLISSLVLGACTKTEEKIIVEKQAPQNMLSSFKVTDSCHKANCITIQKDSLNRIFLLIASGITSGMTPQWYDLKPLVVSFSRSGNKIALIGENYNSIYSEIRTINLIQSFDVVSEDEATITFDWGQGLKTFVLQRPYDVDAPRGEVDLTDSSFVSLPVIDSFVTGIKVNQENIELTQLSKVRSDIIKMGSVQGSLNQEPREETLNMNIQIRPYNLGKAFMSKVYDRSRRVGFFVTKVKKDGYSKEMTNLITKWDLAPEKGPIRVRISKAVPEDYVGAVVEGVLYWNKVFGRDVIVVETGTPTDAGPEHRSIIIRWIPWLDSGAAYAIGQSDPLTGELLRAQVFMPSVFTGVGSAELVKLNGDVPVVAVGAIACDLTESLKGLQKMMREAGDSQRLRLAQDSVRATVAHELGHALGLRHNFAGSSSAKVSTEEIYESAKNYLRDLEHRGLETSTSIMDYVTGIDDVLMAARIKHAPLAYDKMAMDWAYSKGDQALDEKISLYCTDDDIAVANSQGLQVYGCERFDAGNNPLQRKFLEAVEAKEGLVKVLFASIIGRLYPYSRPDHIADLDAVLADTLKWGRANIELDFVSQVLFDSTVNGVLAPKFASLSAVKNGRVVYSKFGLDDAYNQERLRSLQQMGGYAAILNGLLRDKNGDLDLDWFERQIEDLKESPYLISGRTLTGREYRLNVEEQRKILKFFADLRSTNKKVLFNSAVTLLPKFNEAVQDSKGQSSMLTSLLGVGLLTEQDAEQLQALVLDVLSASTGTITVKVGAGLSKDLTLPDPYLTAEERATYAKALSSSGLRYNLTLRLAQVRDQVARRLSAVLAEVDPQLNLVTESQLEKLPERLLVAGLVDAGAASWLKSEIKLWQDLGKVQ